MPMIEAARPAELRGWPDHAGLARPADSPAAVAPPPPEIGPVLSVDPRPRRTGLWSRGGSIAGAVFGPVILLPVLVIAAVPVFRFGSPAVMAAYLGVLLAIGLAVAWLFRRRPATSYVGRDGVAQFRGNRRGAVTRARVLRFGDAADLLTATQRLDYNGLYLGTSYTYAWRAADGRTVYRLDGRYWSRRTASKAGHSFQFAAAAERAWTDHLWVRLVTGPDRQPFIEFRINRSDHVRVGPGFMEFRLGDRTERVTPDDLAKADLRDGVFRLATKDATRFGRTGKFTFNYARTGNARAFLIAVDRLMGIRFG